MAAEDNSIRFSSHKNIAIKEIRENKRKDQTKTQDITKFGLKCLHLRDSQSPTIEVEPNTKNQFYTQNKK
jgi:hypothetical protein